MHSALLQAGITATNVRSAPMTSVSAKISLAYSRTLHMVPSNPWSHCRHIDPLQNSGCDDRHRIYEWYEHTEKRHLGQKRQRTLLQHGRSFALSANDALPDWRIVATALLSIAAL